MIAGTMLHGMMLILIEALSLLAYVIILSSYERRMMSLMHNRDAPISWLLLGMGQPIADGAKLLLKGTPPVDVYHTCAHDASR